MIPNRSLVLILVATGLMTTTPLGGLFLADAEAAAAPPFPRFTVDPPEGTTRTLFHADARASHVPEGATVTWNWGDGFTEEGVLESSHRYASTGRKTVRLTIATDTESVTAAADVSVAITEPADRAVKEVQRYIEGAYDPNHAVEASQQHGPGSSSPGTIVALVSGLDPSALPINGPDGFDIRYATCRAGGCAEAPIASATDPDGTSTAAFSVLIQKAFSARFIVLNVADADGHVTLRGIARALAVANDLTGTFPGYGHATDLVVSILPPDAGFRDRAATGSAFDPGDSEGHDHTTGEEPGDGHGHDDKSSLVAFWNALLANTDVYDFGGPDAMPYPSPMGYNDSRPLPGHGGDGHDAYGGNSHGGAHHGASDDGDVTGCAPYPYRGMHREDDGVAGYLRLLDSVKLFDQLADEDFQHLSPVQRHAVETRGHELLDIVCLHLAVTALAHAGVPLFVPAGDEAHHGTPPRDASPGATTWDLQTVDGLAAFPHVITVGGTTSDSDHSDGTRRIVLPSSNAGPTRSLYGVKPDFLAPADVPIAITPSLAAENDARAAERYHLRDDFEGSGGRWIVAPQYTTRSPGRLHIQGGFAETGVVYNGSTAMPDSPDISATIYVGSDSAIFQFSAQDGTAFRVAGDGYGLEIVPLSNGRFEGRSHVWRNGAEYNPPPAIGLDDSFCASCATDRFQFRFNADTPMTLRIRDVGPAPTNGHRLFTFEILDANDASVGALHREVLADPCDCNHLTILTSGAGYGSATVTDVTATGLATPARAEFIPGTPIEASHPGITVAVRPTTRVSAAYAAAVAVAINTGTITAGDDHDRLGYLRGRLASLAKPLDGVPVFVQGAGELRTEGQETPVIIGATSNVPNVGGIDFGVQRTGASTAHLRFHSDAFLGADQVVVSTTGSTWHRITSALNGITVTPVPANAAPRLTSTSTGSDHERHVHLTMTPGGGPGVYATHVQVRVDRSGLPGITHREYRLPVVVTLGKDLVVPLTNLAIEDGTGIWLLPPEKGDAAGLVYEPYFGVPSAFATASSGSVSFGYVPAAVYSVAALQAESMPLPLDDGSGRTREAGTPRALVLLSGAFDATTPSANVLSRPVPIAWRVLDIIQGAAFLHLQKEAVADPGQLFVNARTTTATPWNRRGDPERGNGHALDDPLPVGETKKGWDVTTMPRAPPTGLGSQGVTETRESYDLAIGNPANPYSRLVASLDTRPYHVDGDDTLPELLATTSFLLPGGADTFHGTVLLPLDLVGADAIVSVAIGDDIRFHAVTRHGITTPVSPDGLTWGALADAFDKLPDATAGGALSGTGHLHPTATPGVTVEKPTAEGYLIPVSFHDLAGGASATVQIGIHVRAHAADLAGRAAGADPMGATPGALVRIDGATLHGWTSGHASRGTNGKIHLEPGDLSRIVPGGDINPMAAPAIRGAPYDASGVLLGEALEAYVRAPADSPARLTMGGTTATDTGFTRHSLGASDARLLQFAFGRAMTPVLDPRYHRDGGEDPGVLGPYAHLEPGYPATLAWDASFGATGMDLLRIDHRAFAAIGGAMAHLDFAGGAIPAAGTILAPTPFPDAPDADAGPAHVDNHCLLDAADVRPLLILPYATLLCQMALPLPDTEAAVDLHELVAHEAEHAGHAVHEAGDIENDTAGRERIFGPGTILSKVTLPSAEACLGTGDIRATCMASLVSYVQTAAGEIRAQHRSDANAARPSVADLVVDGTGALWSGRVPAGGALLLIEYGFPTAGATATAEIRLEIIDASVSHVLTTLEGDARFRASDPFPRGTRLDIIDLSPFAGEVVGISGHTSDPGSGTAPWTIPEVRILPRAPAPPLVPGNDPGVFTDDAGSLPAANIHPAPATTGSVPLGPRQGANLVDNTRIALPSGLTLGGSRNVSDAILTVGTDTRAATITVPDGITLTLSNVIVRPRSPDHPWSLHIAPGGTLIADGVTLVRGGNGATGFATVLVEGSATLTDTIVLGGLTGIRVTGDGVLDATRPTFARLARALEVVGASASLTDPFVDGNALGLVARDGALLHVDGGLFTSNRDAAIRTRDSVVAITGATFAWNGHGGARSALDTREGFGTGRVILDDVTFADNGQAVLTRADVDAHDIRITGTGSAMHIAPDSRVRLHRADVAGTVLVDHAAQLIASESTFAGAITCLDPSTASVVLTAVSAPAGACGGPSSGRPASSAGPDSLWRAIAAPRYVQGGPVPVISLPRGASNDVWDVADPAAPTNEGLTYDGTTLAVADDATNDGVRDVTLVAVPAGDAAPVDTARWTWDLTHDTVAPTVAFEASVTPGFTRARSIPLPFQHADVGAGIATRGVSVQVTYPDGSITDDGADATAPRGDADARIALDGVRGAHAVLGAGTAGTLSMITGEELILTPFAKDRAGNMATGPAVSVILDATPPRAWIHAANPCGNLFGWDIRWNAHDPVVGSGLRPKGGDDDWTYTVEYAPLDLAWLLSHADMAVEGLLKDVHAPTFNQEILTRMRDDGVLRSILSGTLAEEFLLENWILIGQYPLDVTGVDFRPLDIVLFKLANPDLDEATAEALFLVKQAQDARLQELVAGLEDTIAALNPVIAALRVTARDAVGNTATWYEPVMSDVFDPTALLVRGTAYARDRVIEALNPTVSLDLTHMHADVSLFDADCGLDLVDVFQHAIINDVTSPIMENPYLTLYPREGRVVVHAERVRSFFDAAQCGERALTFVARDVFGKERIIDGSTILDRVPPESIVLEWTRNVLIDMDLEIPGIGTLTLDAEVPVNRSWLREDAFHVLAEADSRNACEPASAIHDTRVDLRLRNETATTAWVSFNRTHEDTSDGLDLRTYEADVHVDATRFDLTEADLAGRYVEARVTSHDAVGNAESKAVADFEFRIDRMPPVCDIVQDTGFGGIRLQAQWTAHDDAQDMPGEVVKVLILLGPDGGAGEWITYASPVTVEGGATFDLPVPLDQLPPWINVGGLTPALLVCAAWDAAGNLGASDPLALGLDFQPPTIVMPDPAAFVGAAGAAVNWVASDLLSGVDTVSVHAGVAGGALALQGDYGAVDGFVLVPEDPAAVDGQTWTIRVEVTDNAGNRASAWTNVTFDTTPPAGDLLLDLVDGFLLPTAWGVVPHVDPDAGSGTQSPLLNQEIRATSTATGNTVVFTPGPTGNYALSFAATGTHTLVLHACDAAGNCAEVDTASVKIDLTAPVTRLDAITTDPVPKSLVGSILVHWVADGTTSRWRVADAGEHGSGATDLAVRARHLLPDGSPSPSHEDSTVQLLASDGGDPAFDAVLGLLATNTLLRYEATATDLAGNMENLGTHVPQASAVIARDTLPPVITDARMEPAGAAGTPLTAADPWTMETTVHVHATLADDAHPVHSGLTEYTVRVTDALTGDMTTTTTQLPATGDDYPGRTDITYTITLTAADEGVRYVACVEARDLTANPTPCASAGDVILDLTAPVALLDGLRDRLDANGFLYDATSAVSPTFDATAGPGEQSPLGTVELHLAGPAPDDLTILLLEPDGTFLPGITQAGSYTATLHACDTAGNCAVPDAVAFDVDLTAPVTTIVELAEESTTTTSTMGSPVRWIRDATSALLRVVDPSPQDSGVATVDVTIQPLNNDFTVDGDTPSPTATVTDLGATTDGLGRSYRAAFTALADRLYRYTATATDSAGNQENGGVPAPLSGTVGYDATAPAVDLTLLTPAITKVAEADVSLALTESTAGAHSGLADAAVQVTPAGAAGWDVPVTPQGPVTWTDTITLPLDADGDGIRYTLCASGTDAAGNTGTCPVGASVLVDLTAPTPSLAGLSDQLLASGHIPLVGGVYSALVDVVNTGWNEQSAITSAEINSLPLNVESEVYIIGTDPIDIDPDGGSAIWSVHTPSTGRYSAVMTACDAAGNCRDTDAVEYLVDLAAPVTTIDLGLDGLPTSTVDGDLIHWAGEALTATFTVTDGASAFASGMATLDVTVSTPAGDATYAFTAADGTAAGNDRIFTLPMTLDPHTRTHVLVSATDAVGNVEAVHASAFIAWDPTPPTVTLLTNLPDYVFGATQTVRVQVTDDAPAGGVSAGPALARLRITDRNPSEEGVLWGSLPYREVDAAPDANGVAIFTLVLNEGFRTELRALASDVAGNTADFGTGAADVAVLDSTVPSVVIDPPSGLQDGILYTNDPAATVTARLVNLAPRTDAYTAPIASLEAVVTTNGAETVIPLTVPSGLAANGEHEMPAIAFGGADGDAVDIRVVATGGAGKATGMPIARAHYRLEGNGVDELNQFTMNLAGSPATVSGPDGDALAFNPGVSGNQYAVTTSNYYWGFGNKLTIGGWLKLESVTAGLAPVFASGDASYWGLWLQDGRLQARVRGYTSGFTQLTAPAQIPIGDWTHVAMTYDGSTREVRLVVDGSEVARVIGSARGGVHEGMFYRYMGGGVGGYLHGAIDDLHVGAMALSDQEIRDYLIAGHKQVESNTVSALIDLTAPVATLDTRIATLVAGTNAGPGAFTALVAATDASPGTPSGLADIILEERVLDGSDYTIKPGTHAEGADIVFTNSAHATLPAGSEIRITGTIHAPADGTLATMEYDVSDGLNIGLSECGADRNGRLTIEVVLDGTVVASNDPTKSTLNRQTVTVATATVNRESTLEFVIRTTQEWTPCHGSITVRLHDFHVLTAGTSPTTLFYDTFDTMDGWTVTANNPSLRADIRDAPRTAGSSTDPNLLYGETWPNSGEYGEWAVVGVTTPPNTGRGTRPGPADTQAFRLIHKLETGATTPLPRIDRAGRTLGDLDVTHVRVSARPFKDIVAPGSGSFAGGLELDIGSAHSIVFLFHDDFGTARPDLASTGEGDRTRHYVHVDGTTLNEWAYHDLDLAAAKAAHGITGRVTGIWAWVENQGSASTGRYESEITLDDVQLLRAARTEIDLGFTFPFYGQLYDKVYADEHIVLGFTPDFDGTPTAANFADQPVIAPAWGDFTRQGSTPSSTAPNQGARVLYLPDAVVISWYVGGYDDEDPTRLGNDNTITVALKRTGEIVTSYSRFTDTDLIRFMGVSDGLGKTTTLPSIPTVFNGRAPDAFVPGGSWQEVATSRLTGLGGASGTLTDIGIPTDGFRELRVRAVDRAGNAEPSRDESIVQDTSRTTFSSSASGFDLVNGQVWSNVRWDSANARLALTIDSRDAGDEAMVKNVDIATDEAQSFHARARWATTTRGADQRAFAFVLAEAGATDFAADPGVAAIEYHSGNGAASPVTYRFHYRDAAGTVRLSETFAGVANQEYVLTIDWDGPTRVMTFLMHTPSGVEVAKASVAIPTGAEGFAPQMMGTATDGYGGAWAAVRGEAWVDDVVLYESVVSKDVAETTLHVDTRGPFLAIGPAINEYGGLDDRNLKVLVTAVDAGFGVDGTSVFVTVKDAQGTVLSTTPATGGRDVLVDVGTVIEHNGAYVLTLVANDLAGHGSWIEVPLTAQILPEPVITFPRALDGVTYVDDVARGASTGIVAVLGDRFTVDAAIESFGADVESTVFIDGVARGDWSGGDLRHVLDVASLSPGIHTLRIRAEIEDTGSFAEETRIFEVKSPDTHEFDVDDPDAWALGGSAQRQGGGRTGDQVVVLDGSTSSAEASVVLPRDTASGTYWTFSRIPSAPLQPITVLRLANSEETAIMTLRVLPDGGIEGAIEGGVWVPLDATFAWDRWIKIDVRNAGNQLHVAVDHAHAGTFSTTTTAVVRTLHADVPAGSGELHLDDWGWHDVDAIMRRVLYSPGSSSKWLPAGSVSTTDDPVMGGRGFNLQSASPATRTLDEAVIGDHSLVVDVRAHDDPCVSGRLVGLVAADETWVAGIRCGSSGMEVVDGNGWSPTGIALTIDRYTTIRLAIGYSQYSVFLDESLTGTYPLGTLAPATEIHLGGGVDAWFNALSVERGRVLIHDSFDTRIPAYWSVMKSGTGKVEHVTNPTFAGAGAVRITGDPMSSKTTHIDRSVSLPESWSLSTRVYIPTGTTFDRFSALRLANTAGPMAEIILKTAGTKIDAFAWSPAGEVRLATLAAGEWFSLQANRDGREGVIDLYADGIGYTVSATGPVTRLGAGDYNLAQGAIAGELVVDRWILSSGNTRPVIASDLADGSPVSGVHLLTGTVQDFDVSDVVETLSIKVGSGTESPLAIPSEWERGESWQWLWDTTALPDGPTAVELTALQDGFHTSYSFEFIVSNGP